MKSLAILSEWMEYVKRGKADHVCFQKAKLETSLYSQSSSSEL